MVRKEYGACGMHLIPAVENYPCQAHLFSISLPKPLHKNVK